jgi:purine-binding chemotaxis protein CheW
MPETQSHAEPFLICRSAGNLCALPLDKVGEIMRPLPLERAAKHRPGEPPLVPFVLGAAIIRGAAIPVVSLAGLLGEEDAAPAGRYVSLRLGERRAALAVGSVEGIRELRRPGAIAPLLGAIEHEAVAAIAAHDAELLFVLEAAKLVPEEAWGEAPGGDAEAAR